MFALADSEVPLQLYHLVGERVHCYRAAPAERLRDYIYYYWWVDVAPGNTTLEVIPDNAIDLVMSPGIENFSILYLPATDKFTIPLYGPITYVGISFRAGAASAFFNVSQGLMQGCAPGEDATERLSITALVDGIQALEQSDQLASTLDALALARLSDRPAAPQVTEKLDVNKALAAMQGSVGARGMEEIAGLFDMSDRQFRRVMGSLFGYGPKKIQRVMRLQASLKALFTSNALALEDGFYDEAHKIKEIRALTGLAPGQIKRMSEIYNAMR